MNPADAILKRACEYRLLSECLKPPTDELKQILKTCRQELDLADDLLSAAEPWDLVELSQDYTRLLIGPFKALAPPCGSVYLETKPQMMGDSTMDALAWYREDGLEVCLQEPPDHLVVEFEYLHFLATKAAAAEWAGESPDCWLQREADFISQHLGRWLPAFAENVCSNAEAEFYRVLARAARCLDTMAVHVG